LPSPPSSEEELPEDASSFVPHPASANVEIQ